MLHLFFIYNKNKRSNRRQFCILGVGDKVQLSDGMGRQMDRHECIPPERQEMKGGGDWGDIQNVLSPKPKGREGCREWVACTVSPSL